jgi:hypothetical protein
MRNGADKGAECWVRTKGAGCCVLSAEWTLSSTRERRESQRGSEHGASSPQHNSGSRLACGKNAEFTQHSALSTQHLNAHPARSTQHSLVVLP